jgi:hypothetical protein
VIHSDGSLATLHFRLIGTRKSASHQFALPFIDPGTSLASHLASPSNSVSGRITGPIGQVRRPPAHHEGGPQYSGPHPDLASEFQNPATCDLPTRALLHTGSRKARIPDQRNDDRSAVDQVYCERVFGDPHIADTFSWIGREAFIQLLLQQQIPIFHH